MKIAATLLLSTMACTASVETPSPAPVPMRARIPVMVNQSPVPTPSPLDGGGDSAVAPQDAAPGAYGLALGSDCTPGGDGGEPCATEAYEGPLIAAWGCYPLPGSTRSVCAFRCDDFTGTPSSSDAQVSYEQTAPPVCTQLGGTCVPAPGLPMPAQPGVILENDGGSPSLCVVK